MTDPMPDAERLAALIDGRLDERERADLLARLALSEEDLAVLADAGAVTRELEEEDRAAAVAGAGDGVGKVVPLGVKRGASRYRRWTLLAASLAGIALAGTYLGTRTDALARSPVSVVDHLAGARLPLPGGFAPAPWGGARGEEGLEGRFTAGMRIGAGLTDLQMAAARGDPALATYAGQLAHQLDEAKAPPKEVAFYDGLAGGNGATSGASARELKKHAARVASAGDSTAVAIGAWAQAARVAAARGDSAFFAATGGTLARFPDAPDGMGAAAARALRGVKAELRAPGPKDWTRLGTELEAVLGAEPERATVRGR